MAVPISEGLMEAGRKGIDLDLLGPTRYCPNGNARNGNRHMLKVNGRPLSGETWWTCHNCEGKWWRG